MTTTAERDAFLQEANVAVLSTLDRRGRPHGVPIWFLYEDGVFVMITGRRSQKARNIERNPEVSLVIDRRTLPYYAVMVQGPAEIGPAPSRELHRRMAVRYLGEELGQDYHERRYSEDAVTIRLRPATVVQYQGAAGRDRDG
jgi:PPOX class probable F420-dependent enzyme